MRTGSSVRSAGSLAPDLAGTGRCWTSTSFVLALGFLLRLLAGRHLFLRLGLLGLDHVDAHLAELRQDVLDLLGLDLL